MPDLQGCVGPGSEPPYHVVASAVGASHPVPLAYVGVQDVFGASGEADELLTKYGLAAKKIAEAAIGIVKRR